eukprot:CAMPEP_0202687190 /NCGR_PEP_ID=MMETSP1385-20130828/2890_1 /ASSEMBLY_ACC=CAM_ASM_000861 /TAXON_ID=933848 /ORGANISM="Elphidium margaritaceum" /LENGTH=698 /DNA_ID=CAMNT_0049341941 /DNA_START=55 /DNA_END=2151 /DNA_ORIENTATION=-
MFDAKNTTIVFLLAVIVYFIRDRRLTRFNASLRNVIQTNDHYLPPQTVHEKLKAHSAQFNKAEIIEVTDGVFVAIGYALANSIIIEGSTSLIVVDTMESLESAQKARQDFIAATPKHVHSKPVSHVIYTHYHPDHTWGTSAWIDDEHHTPTIMSHARTLKEMTRVFSISASITNIRSMRQFGPLLHEYDQMHLHAHAHDHDHGEHAHDFHSGMYKQDAMEDVNHSWIDFNDEYNQFSNVFENSGIGPFLLSGPRWSRSLHLPTKLLTQEINELRIDGVAMKIVHAPGETADQIFIYLTEKRVLLPADNIYRTYPNIYAIRGSPTRDARDWTRSLDKMRALQPAPLIMVPGHTRPVYGEHEIQQLLTVYRDGISYTHDQTIRYMNNGLTPDEMIPLIHENMPLRLKHHPYLQEFYGTVDWSVRGIFHSYLGWFSGDAADLFPLTKTDSGNRLFELLKGDTDYLLGVIRQHVSGGDGDENGVNSVDRNSCQWGLKLATELLHSSKLNGDERKIAKDLRITALQCMASFMTSANGRNYYLTSALEDITNSKITLFDSLKEFGVNSVPLDQVIAMLRVRLRVETVPEAYKNFSVCHDLHHVWYYLDIREGVIEAFKGYDASYTETDDTIKRLNREAYIDREISRQDCHENAVIVTLCEEQVFRDAVAQTKTTPAMLFAAGKFKIIKGKITEMLKFKEMFEKQ